MAHIRDTRKERPLSNDLLTACDIVRRLNDLGQERIGMGAASVESDGINFLVLWDGLLLYDSGNYTHRDDMDFSDEEGYELSYELCMRMLTEHTNRLRDLTRPATEEPDG